MSIKNLPELREVASRVYNSPHQVSIFDALIIHEALHRLADVIEYAEPIADEENVLFAGTVKRWPHIAEVLRIARGEAFTSTTSTRSDDQGDQYSDANPVVGAEYSQEEQPDAANPQRVSGEKR